MTEKNVPKLRFSGFNETWVKSNLGNVSSDEMYGMNSAATDFDGFNKYIRITDISESSNKFVPSPLTSPDGNLDEKFKLKEGDIVFARTGASTGKTYIYDKNDGNLYFAGFLIKFNINKAYPKFVFYNTLKDEYKNWVSVMSVRSGQPGINSNEYKKLPLNIPSLDEQKKISDFLESIDSKINLLKKKYEYYQEFKKYLMQQIFAGKLRFAEFEDDWIPYKIGDISKTYSGGTPSTSKKEYYEGNIPFIKSGEINNDVTEQYITEDALKNSSAKRVQKGDLLLALYGATSGEVAISKIDGAINQAVLKIDNNMDNYFQYCYFLMYKDQIVHKYIQGGQGNLSANIIKKLEFKYPSLAEQKKISQFFMSFDNKLELYENKIIKYNNLKKGLLQQMFGYVHIILNFCVKICFIR